METGISLFTITCSKPGTSDVSATVSVEVKDALPDLTAAAPTFDGTVYVGVSEGFSANITSSAPINSVFDNIFQISTKKDMHLP